MLLSRVCSTLLRVPSTRTKMSIPSGAAVQKAFQDAVKPSKPEEKKLESKEEKPKPVSFNFKIINFVHTTQPLNAEEPFSFFSSRKLNQFQTKDLQ